MTLLAAAFAGVVLTAAPIRLAAPGLALVNVDEKLGSFFNEHIALQLKLARIEVVTQREMQSLLGMERQKQLLGCQEGSSCMAEIANALGTDGMLMGDIAKVGTRYQLNLKIISATNSNTLAVFAENVSAEDQVVDALTRGAYLLAVDVSHALGRPPPPEVGGGADTRKFAWAPLALGAIGVVGGAVAIGVSEGAYQKLKNDAVVLDGAQTLALGKTTGNLAVAGFTVGGVALAGAAALLLFGGRPAPVSVAVGPQGAAVVFQGAFP
jgi:hypothetical protein